MHRIDTSTAQKDKFGSGKNGFTEGNPQTGAPATALNSAFFDSIQEEIAAVIESTGVTLDASKNDQLKTAITAIISGAMPAIPVTSVNGEKGDVELSAEDVDALSVDGTATAATKLATARKIAGHDFDGTADISITADDVDALPSTYTPPPPDLSAYITTSAADAKYQLKDTASKAVNGWEKDSVTGIIRQWGTFSGAYANSSITFPLAFPSTCSNVILTQGPLGMFMMQIWGLHRCQSQNL
ncbi:hypothetical protein CEQ28_023465 [Hafnia alvei]|nr:hypothetical protein CEQ28_023465 [Hafnia alvei]